MCHHEFIAFTNIHVRVLGANPLGTFLGQEIERFNRLLSVVQLSLDELQSAIKGRVVMSAELEHMHSCLLYNTVPPAWTQVCFLELCVCSCSCSCF